MSGAGRKRLRHVPCMATRCHSVIDMRAKFIPIDPACAVHSVILAGPVTHGRSQTHIHSATPHCAQCDTAIVNAFA